MLRDFEGSPSRGNLVDLAVAFIIGAAFSGLVQSLVNDIVMPDHRVVTGGIDFSELYIQLAGDPQPTLAQARRPAQPRLRQLHHAGHQLLIVAWVLFLVVKGMNKLKREKGGRRRRRLRRPGGGSLAEIRDLLAKRG
jgi:large conductance mechanosensitive channel